MRPSKEWIRKLLIQLTEPASQKAARAFGSKGFDGPTVEQLLGVHWEITAASLAALEKSQPWKRWAASEGFEFTATGIYGPDGKLGYWGRTWPTATAMQQTLSHNMGGGVPIEIIKELVKLSTVSDPFTGSP